MWDPGSIEHRGYWAPPQRRAGVILVAVAAMSVVLSFGFATWFCGGTYNCPANGCGPVPAQNCSVAQSDLLGIALFALLLAILAVGLMFGPIPSRGSPPYNA